LIITSAVLAFAGLPAQQPRFGTSVQVVEVYASVTDQHGTPIEGLERHRFTLTQDGQSQAITTFAEGDFPLSLAIAVDRSWSMAREKLAEAREAAHGLLNELRPTDETMIVAVSGEITTVAPLSRDKKEAHSALDRLDPWSTTALRDAIIGGIDQIRTGTGRRALVLLSDGVDRYSHASAADVLQHARESDVIVYPVAIGRTRPLLFAEVAALTGGRSFLAADARALAAALHDIARELRHQYLLGYTPDIDAAPGWHSIRLSVDLAGARVRARDGYWVH
jgi:Ca-activated chloride channel homolog